MADDTTTQPTTAPSQPNPVPQPPAPKPAKAPASNGITVEDFLSNSRLVKEKSRYAQAAFKPWIKEKQKQTVGARKSNQEWEALFTTYLNAPTGA